MSLTIKKSMITTIAIALIMIGVGLLWAKNFSKKIDHEIGALAGPQIGDYVVELKKDESKTIGGLTITHTGSDTVEYAEPVDGAVGATYDRFLLELNGKKKEIGFSSGPQKNSVQWEGYVVKMNEDGSITVRKI